MLYAKYVVFFSPDCTAPGSRCDWGYVVVGLTEILTGEPLKDYSEVSGR